MREESSGGVDLGNPDEQYALLMECVTDYAIFLMDTDGRVAAWNAGAERIFGYSEEEALGLPFADFFHPDDRLRDVHQKELHLAVKNGRAIDDKWHVRKDGSLFWASGITTALRDDDGDLRGFAKVTRDRTERKMAEESLRDANRRKEEFLAVLAHELRGPLAPVTNSVQVLRLLSSGNPVADQAHATIDRQIKHLTRLVDDLLDISRINQGKFNIKMEILELAQVVAQAVEASRPLIDARKHGLTITLPHHPVRVNGDSARLIQVFNNLLTNSAKYTPEGGRIWLMAEQEDDAAVVRIRDTGLGISREMLPAIFELFAQADRAKDAEEGGLGIGLSLVKSLVELHGGSVSANSEGLGKGCEFVVRLPLSTQPAAPEKTADQGSNGAPVSAADANRVLVVDDNRDAANSLAILIQAWGHQIRVAHEGLHALEVAREFRPDVVLLDLGLPGMPGVELAEQLRQEPGLEKTFLVALTGYGADEDRRRTSEAGFQAHLVKPADLNELQTLLANRRAAGG
jgi:PAS domain S-box-containing protein